jgi:hypothetical protein
MNIVFDINSTTHSHFLFSVAANSEMKSSKICACNFICYKGIKIKFMVRSAELLQSAY